MENVIFCAVTTFVPQANANITMSRVIIIPAGKYLFKLTLHCLTSQNGQTHFNNLAADFQTMLTILGRYALKS